MKKHLIAAALLAATALSSNAVELVTNGSFEDDIQDDNTWSIYANLNGWTGGALGIEQRNAVAGQAWDGYNFVELDTTGNSSMWQYLDTKQGTHYTLTFGYSARPGTSGMAADTNDIQVYWNNQLVTTLSAVNPSPTDHDWHAFSFDVVGGEGPSRLKFVAVGTNDSYGGSLDAVSVTQAVPEPGTFALLLAGLGAVGLLSRRRRG